jgi:adenylate kinase family enzyme
MRKSKAAGTDVGDPVAADWNPDLVKSRNDIDEYLEDQNAYVLFDSMLKELIKKQPKDPIAHMLQYLQAGVPQPGPLCVVISRAPGAAMGTFAKEFASSLGLQLVSAGELLRGKGVETNRIGLADDAQVAELVIAKVKEAGARHQGIVLDGFPRTPTQTTFLKEHRIVPTHVLVLAATEATLEQRRQMIDDGAFEGYDSVVGQALELKMGAYLRHAAVSLEAYKDKTTVINLKDAHAGASDADVVKAMQKVARVAPRSRGPTLPPRVVVLAPQGTANGAGMAYEHARRLAQRLGAVFIDAVALQRMRSELPQAERLGTLFDIPDVDSLSAKDPLGVVGVRLRQIDCTRRGWVLLGFPQGEETAARMIQDDRLQPSRVIAYPVSADQAAVSFAQQSSVNILGASKSSKILEVQVADKAEEDVFEEVAGFVERPLLATQPSDE